MFSIVPDKMGAGKNAMIYINGGGNPLGGTPDGVFDTRELLVSFSSCFFAVDQTSHPLFFAVPPIAIELGDIIAELNQIPNQPLTFEGEDFGRSEDSLLAKSWDMFIETRDPMVIGWTFLSSFHNQQTQKTQLTLSFFSLMSITARLPMAKSVVRAMDSIQEFIASRSTIPVPKAFVLAGGSKRGW